MKLNKYWDVEDIFFGALFGAVYGTFAVQALWHTFFLTMFFVIFPVSIRKADKKSNYSLVAVSAASILWVILFFGDLFTSNLISSNGFFASVIVFVGWMVSVFVRIVIK